ncbi:MAG: hypothetical protein WA913_05420, partial [Pricia sp.]
EYGIDVLYSFWVPGSIDFVRDTTGLENLKSQILKDVKKLKSEENIIGWNIANDIWTNLGLSSNYAEVELQRKAYLVWMAELINGIRQIDSRRWITKDVRLSQWTTDQVSQVEEMNIALDGIDLIVKDDYFLEDFLGFAEANEVQYIISEIEATTFHDHRNKFSKTPVILANWQNKWESHNITLDGLLDFEGRKKPDYILVRNAWGDTQKNIEFPEIKILRPAQPMLPNRTATFRALENIDSTWTYIEDNDNYSLEWSLVRSDEFENITAIKKLGNGPSISFILPKNHQSYRLVLTLVENGYSVSVKSSLNTPLLLN